MENALWAKSRARSCPSEASSEMVVGQMSPTASSISVLSRIEATATHRVYFLSRLAEPPEPTRVHGQKILVTAAG